jgi:general secretion pathway protein C
MIKKFGFIIIIMIVSSCATSGGSKNTETPKPEASDKNENTKNDVSTVENQEAAPPNISTVSRSDLNNIIKKGPANILAMVQMDSVKNNGKFTGFKIISFRFNAASVLGLKPGDVLLKVNGLAIETPDQYFEVFERLKKAEFVEFKILRDETPLTLKTEISSN